MGKREEGEGRRGKVEERNKRRNGGREVHGRIREGGRGKKRLQIYKYSLVNASGSKMIKIDNDSQDNVN